MDQQITLTSADRAAIVAQARAATPNECCGVLAGRGSAVERVLPLANADASPTSFRADPIELLRALESIDAAGLDLVGIYHSHPRTVAYPSPTDVGYARGYYGICHLIVSLRDPDHPEVRAFRIGGQEITPVDIIG